jgi:hypothetical protein
MPFACASQQRCNLVNDLAGVVPTVCLTHRADPTPLLLDRAARFAHIDEAPNRLGEVRSARSGSDALVPVDQADCLIANEDGVVRPEVTVTDDLLTARQLAARRPKVATQPRERAPLARADESRSSRSRSSSRSPRLPV